MTSITKKQSQLQSFDDNTKGSLPKKTILHPLVLLSIVDHYNRVAKDHNKRVCGVLLGRNVNQVVHVTNSFAVLFEEDPVNTSSWYLDHNYLENFMTLQKKVTSSEKIVGWYSSSPLIQQNDIHIHEVFRKYCPEPIFYTINVQDSQQESNDSNKFSAPAKAFCSISTKQEEGTISSTSIIDATNTNLSSESAPQTHTSFDENHQFVHVHLELGADEAEEIGLEHVLRTIQQQHHVINSSSTKATLNETVVEKIVALNGFHQKLRNISLYLDDVVNDKLPYNAPIINRIQDIVSLVPVITNSTLSSAIAEYSTDSMIVVYISSIIRSINALHDLVKNTEMVLASDKDEKIKKAFIESTKVNNNVKNAKNSTDDEFNMDSVAHDRGDENKQ